MLRHGSNGKQQPGSLGKGAGGTPQPEIKIQGNREENRPAPMEPPKYDQPTKIKGPSGGSNP